MESRKYFNYATSALLLILAGMPHCGLAQSATQRHDATLRPRLTLQDRFDQSGTGVVRDALGRPCLDVEAVARPEVVNPDMLDHVVSLKNNCPKFIRAKVCYFNSDRCRDLEVQAYKRVDTILGSMRGVSFFRYSIVQK